MIQQTAHYNQLLQLSFIGCLQRNKFEIPVDGQIGRESIYWSHFEIWRHLKSLKDVLPSFYLASSL